MGKFWYQISLSVSTYILCRIPNQKIEYRVQNVGPRTGSVLVLLFAFLLISPLSIDCLVDFEYTITLFTVYNFNIYLTWYKTADKPLVNLDHCFTNTILVFTYFLLALNKYNMLTKVCAVRSYYTENTTQNLT